MTTKPSALSLDDAEGGLLSDTGTGGGADARPFAWGQEKFSASARLAGMERIGERLARGIRSVVEPFARTKTQVEVGAAEAHRFDAWCAALPRFTSLSLYRVRPLKGGLLIAVEPRFVTGLVDAFYGGTGTAQPSKATEFTPTEERILGKLTDAVAERLAEAWSDLVTFVPVLASRETNTAYASLVRGDEMVVEQRFTITPGQGRPTEIATVYPLAALRQFESQLGAKVHDEAGPADPDWRARMAAALEHVQLPVRSVLARPELSVSQLLQLKAGDVIPITLAPKVPLIVASRKLASGTIGERDGRAALMIEEMERERRR